MVWLIIAVIIIALLVLAILSPVIFSIDSTRSEGKIEASFSISWLMLLTRYALIDKQIEIFVFNRRIVSQSHKEKAPEDIERPKRPKRPKKYTEPKKSRLYIRHTFNLIGPLIRFLIGLVSAFRLKQLYIDMTYGLSDPACTGILTGFLYAARGAYQTGQNIRFSPDFTGPILDWDLKAEASIIPVRIIPPVSKLVINRQVLRAVWGIARE